MEIWQANAAGRYIHSKDHWDARSTRTSPVPAASSPMRGALPLRHHPPRRLSVGNHKNAWRPAHIHLSLLGPAFATRLVTQLYFPDDP